MSSVGIIIVVGDGSGGVNVVSSVGIVIVVGDWSGGVN